MIWHDMIWYDMVFYDVDYVVVAMIVMNIVWWWWWWWWWFLNEKSILRVRLHLILFYFILFGFTWLGRIPFVLLVLSFLQWHSLPLHHIISYHITSYNSCDICFSIYLFLFDLISSTSVISLFISNYWSVWACAAFCYN